jgi:hypothetical protein
MHLAELEPATQSDIVLPQSVATYQSHGSAPLLSRSLNRLRAWRFPILIGAILAAGILLRLFLPAGFGGTGFDENLYRTYVVLLDQVGLDHYPSLTDAFVTDQLNPGRQAILPPTRLVYIVGGYIYHKVLGLTPLVALHALSCQFSILTLLVSAIFCWRLTKQRGLTAAVTALVACAATQIHLGQHALIDGVFGFWALLVIWLLWENLKRPNVLRWEVAYGLALTGMVMTKENSFFVVAGVVGILATNRWLKIGHVTRRLLVTTFLGALAGIAVVVVASGGVEQFALIFALLKQKVPVLPYTIKTGGGPWHRYLVDLVLVSPAIILLASANMLQARGKMSTPCRYLAAFSCLSYAVLTAFPDGMNLRYIVMLDMPLRFLAATQLFELSAKWGRYKNPILVCAVISLCTYDLWQHHVLFVKGGLYELVTEGLVRAQGIIK